MTYIVEELRNMLSQVGRQLDEQTTVRFMQYASFYHSQAAQEITQTIIDFIKNVSHQHALLTKFRRLTAKSSSFTSWTQYLSMFKATTSNVLSLT
jgi:hypothetical protein